MKPGRSKRRHCQWAREYGAGGGGGAGSQRSASYLEMKCKEKKITKTKFLTFLFLNSWNCNTLKRGLGFVCIHMHSGCVCCVCGGVSVPLCAICVSGRSTDGGQTDNRTTDSSFEPCYKRTPPPPPPVQHIPFSHRF